MNIQALALHGHMKPVTQIRFNADGDLLFSVAKEGKACVWYTKTGELLGTFDCVKAVSGCDVNRSSTLFATSGFDSQTMLWNVETGAQLGIIPHEAPTKCCQFSHDDHKLLVVTDNKMGQKSKIQLFDLPRTLGDDPLRQDLKPKNAFISDAAGEAIQYAEWGPTNQHIYAGLEDGTVLIIDAERMQEVRSVPGVHRQPIRKLHFDSNYYTLATAGGEDKTAKLFDARDLRTIQTYASDVPVNDIAISPIADHVILGGGMDAQNVTTQGGKSTFEVKFYHKVFGDSLGSIKCHFGTINTVAFLPNGRGFASAGVDGFIKVVNFDKAYDKTPGAKPLWKHPSIVAAEAAASNRSDDDDDADDAEMVPEISGDVTNVV